VKVIDLRSDTVTRPTEEMRRAMATAEVGDDVYGEDPTVNRLEELAAEKVGKEAALFVPSGTMGNQVAIMTHANRGDEVIVEAESHVFIYEVGGIAALTGAQPRQLKGKNGIPDPADIRSAIRDENIHFPTTRLLCLENTHNRAGGTVISPEKMGELAEAARERGVSIHLDGARIFNAAVALGVDVKELVRDADSVMFCLSKGLGAPVGSILAGTREFIKRARKNRKIMGGGMRQAGILAAAGIVALEKMVDRLAEDHANARLLAEGIAELKGIKIDLDTVQTNIIILEVDKKTAGMSAKELTTRLFENGIKANAYGEKIRLVTHKDISRQDIQTTLSVMWKILR